ncbi:MAG: ABC transporter permease [Solirubrobacterales bacterium]
MEGTAESRLDRVGGHLARVPVRFLASRLLGALGVLLAISFIVFVLQELAPGDLAESLLPSGVPVRPQTLAAINHEYGLDKPLLSRYVSWLGGAVHLDFGTSVRTGASVSSLLAAHVAITLELGLTAFVVAMAGGVSLGTAAALHHRGKLDRGLVGLVVALVSSPPFVLGLLLAYALSYKLDLLPATGAGSGFSGRVEHLILPSIALAFTALALVMKLTRAAMLATLDQDYATFATARGIPRRKVILNYALRNAAITIVGAGGIVLGYVLTGAVLVESVFALPGLGSLLVDSARQHDIPAIQGIAMLFAVFIIAVNFVTDVVYAAIDPRLRLS